MMTVMFSGLYKGLSRGDFLCRRRKDRMIGGIRQSMG